MYTSYHFRWLLGVRYFGLYPYSVLLYRTVQRSAQSFLPPREERYRKKRCTFCDT